MMNITAMASWAEPARLLVLLTLLKEEQYNPVKVNISDICIRAGFAKDEVGNVSRFLRERKFVKFGEGNTLTELTAKGNKGLTDLSMLEAELAAHVAEEKRNREQESGANYVMDEADKTAADLATLARLALKKKTLWKLIAGLIASIVFLIAAVYGLSDRIHAFLATHVAKMDEVFLFPEKLPVNLRELVTQHDLDQREIQKLKEQLKEQGEATQVQAERINEHARVVKEQTRNSAEQTEVILEQLADVRKKNQELARQLAVVLDQRNLDTNAPSSPSPPFEIELQWNSTNDLDLHLESPSRQVCWFNNSVAPGAVLENDIRTGGGAETIKILSPKKGRYTCYIHNFAGPPGTTAEITFALAPDGIDSPKRIEIYNERFKVGRAEVVMKITFVVGEQLEKSTITNEDVPISELLWMPKMRREP